MHAYHTGSYEVSSKSLDTCLCYLFYWENDSVIVGSVFNKARCKRKYSISKDNLSKTVERFLVDRLNLKDGVFSFTPGFVKYASNNYGIVSQ